MILCIFVMSIVPSPFSFLTLLIWVLHLFCLISLARGLSILLIFSKNQLCVSLIFSMVFFVSISLISDLIFMISFLLLTLGVVCSSLSSYFRCKVRLFMWVFSCFLRWACIAIDFPPRMAFAASHRFWGVVSLLAFASRYFLISSLISSLIHWLFSSMFSSLHVFVFFAVFFLVVDFQLYSVWSETLSVILNLPRLYLWPECDLS